MAENAGAGNSKAILRAAAILEAFTTEEPEHGVRALAEKLGLPTSTVQRIASTLVSLGYLEQDPATDKYRLGLKLLQLGARVHQQRDFRGCIRSRLERLVRETGETAYLATLTPRGEGVYLEKVFSSATIRAASSGHDMTAPESTAIGRVLLAYLPDEVLEKRLSQHTIKARTPSTVTDKEELLRILRQIRAQGYAVDREEYEAGLWCVAVPVFGSRADRLAALAILGPTSRMAGYSIPQLVEILRSAAADIAGELDIRPFRDPAA